MSTYRDSVPSLSQYSDIFPLGLTTLPNPSLVPTALNGRPGGGGAAVMNTVSCLLSSWAYTGSCCPWVGKQGLCDFTHLLSPPSWAQAAQLR